MANGAVYQFEQSHFQSKKSKGVSTVMSGQDDFFDDLDSLQDGLDDFKDLGETSPTVQPTFWKIFYDLSLRLNSCLGNFDEVLELVMSAAFSISEGQRIFLFLFDENNQLSVHIAKDKEGNNLPKKDQKISQTILDTVLERKTGLFLDNIDTSEKMSQALSVQELKILSAMCVPLKAEIRQERDSLEDENSSSMDSFHKIIGLLYVDSQSLAPTFDKEKLELLQMLANYATTAILQAKYYQQSTKDSHTGVFTRSYFEILLQDVWALAKRTNKSFVLIMIDINQFHHINRRYGYAQGDLLIQKVAKNFQNQLRFQDFLARYGGDEFVAILPESDEVEGKRISHKILKNLSPFLDSWDLTASLGMACAVLEKDSTEKIKEKVLQALSQSKLKKEPTIISWNPSLEEISPQVDRLAGIFRGDPAKDYRNILALMETIGDVNSTLETEKLLHLIVDRMIDLAGAERGILVIAKEESFEVKIARNRDKTVIPKEDLKFSRSILKKIFSTKKPIYLQDSLTSNLENSLSPSMMDLDLRSIMAFPLLLKNKILGAVYVDSKASDATFDTSELAFFSSLGSQLALALENARLFEANQEKRKALQELNLKLAELNQKLEVKVEIQADEIHDIKEELENKRVQLNKRYCFGNIIGKSFKMQQIYQTLEKISHSEVPVFIQGESGTGKEMIAKAIHFNSPRSQNNMVSENCAALNEQLLESELFGYVKGAFTGADKDKKGLFEQAEGGSLFLDEIGDMSLGMQKKLLRVLQEKELRKVGGSKIIPTNVRIISATNRDLMELIQKQEFRQDLYYRINVIRILLPPLRERKEDIPLLMEHFLEKISRENNRSIPKVPQRILQALLNYSWPGNIRELENEIAKLVVLAGSSLEWEMLSPHIREKEQLAISIHAIPLQSLKEMEKKAILATLKANQWNKQKSAKHLGITRKTLYNKMDTYQIQLKKMK